MKTQRRHELQTNQLADRIGVYLQKVRPYQKQILYGVAAVAVLGGAVLYLSSQQQAKAGVSWQEYFGDWSNNGRTRWWKSLVARATRRPRRGLDKPPEI